MALSFEQSDTAFLAFVAFASIQLCLCEQSHIHDTIAGKEVLQATREKYPSIEGISADAGYRKPTENFVINQLKKLYQ